MTAQIHDSFLFNDKEYSIVGVNGDGLFDPFDFQLRPLGLCSACWRGYLCQYTLKDNKILIKWLRINLEHSDQNQSEFNQWPVINGVSPGKPHEDYPMFDTVYQNLDLPIAFSGGILLAEGFISELYVHMGFHPAWKFRTVYELLFKNGIVQEIRDVSQRVAEIREMLQHKSLEWDGKGGREKLEEWIKSTFRLDYHL
jgi:hypothetical protein